MINKLKDLRTQAEINEDGFTLIELMIVVVIIGILAAIAIPVFANQQKSALAAGVKSDVKNMSTVAATGLTKNPTTADVAALLGVVQGNAITTANKGTNTNMVISDDGTELTIVGGWNNYSIKGQNAAAEACFYFTSNTGKIADCVFSGTVASPSAPTITADFSNGVKNQFTFGHPIDTSDLTQHVYGRATTKIDEQGRVEVSTDTPFTLSDFNNPDLGTVNGTYNIIFQFNASDGEFTYAQALPVVDGVIADTFQLPADFTDASNGTRFQTGAMYISGDEVFVSSTGDTFQ